MVNLPERAIKNRSQLAEFREGAYLTCQEEKDFSHTLSEMIDSGLSFENAHRRALAEIINQRQLELSAAGLTKVEQLTRRRPSR